jgi:hypothetical protein
MKKVDITQLIKIIKEALQNGKTFELPVAGNSMQPFFKPGRDVVVLKTPVFPLKKGSVALFFYLQRGQYAMHRVVGVQKSGSEYYYTFMGDNCKTYEENIPGRDVVAVVESVKSGGKTLRLNSPLQKLKFWGFKTFFKKRLTKAEKAAAAEYSKALQAQQTKKTEGMFAFLIKLVAAAVNEDAQPPQPPNGVNWGTVLQLAEMQMITSPLYYALKKYGGSLQMPTVLLNRIADLRRTYLQMSLRRDFEAQEILNEFEQAKIKVLPHKGWFLKEEYPSTDMRMMSDIDFLIEEQALPAADAILKRRGLKTELKSQRGNSYSNKPNIYLEVHTSLTKPDDENFAYFKTIWQNAYLVQGSEYIYRLTDEYEYLYAVQHIKHHLYGGGVGIKMLLDIYLMNKNHPHLASSAVIKEQLAKIGLTDFEKAIANLCQSWFADPQANIIIDDVAQFVLNSGTYGSINTAVPTQQKRTGARYFLSKLFPTFDYLSAKVNVLKKAPFLYPFAVVYFWCWRLFVKRNVSAKAITRYSSTSWEQGAKRTEEVFLKLGIKTKKQ